MEEFDRWLADKLADKVDAEMMASEPTVGEEVSRVEADEVSQEVLATMAKMLNGWELLYKVAEAFRAGKEGASRAMLHGPVGTGKTYLAARMAREDQEVFMVTCHEDLSAFDLWGYRDAISGTHEWIPGVAARAWACGGLLVLNEVENAGESALLSLYAILDAPAVAQYTLPTGDTLRPAPGFSAVATSNDPDRVRGPIRDRLPIWMEVSSPSPEALEAMKAYSDAFAKVTLDAYSGVLEGEEETSLRPTYRQMLAAAQLSGHLGVRTACQVVFPPKVAGQVLLALKGKGMTL